MHQRVVPYKSCWREVVEAAEYVAEGLGSVATSAEVSRS